MTGRGKKQVSKGKGPVILAAAPLSHSNLDEPPSRSGSPATAKKPRKDCRITDRFHALLACWNQVHSLYDAASPHPPWCTYTTGAQHWSAYPL